MWEKPGRGLVQCIKDHNDRDNKSHIFKHYIEKKHTKAELNEFKIFGWNCKNK